MTALKATINELRSDLGTHLKYTFGFSAVAWLYHYVLGTLGMTALLPIKAFVIATGAFWPAFAAFVAAALAAPLGFAIGGMIEERRFERAHGRAARLGQRGR